MLQTQNLFLAYTEKMRETRQGSGGFEYDARQPRLAMEAYVKPDKTRKRKENAAGDQTKHGDSCCSAKRVNACLPMYLTSILR